MDPAPINPALKRKVQKALQININDPSLLLALRNLSTFYTHNSQSARWGLRDQLENKSLEVSAEVIEAFQSIDAELEALKGEIDLMMDSCLRMQETVGQVKASNGLAIQQAENLFHAQESTQVQMAVAQTFLAKFTLTQTQIRSIKNADVNNEFFDALRRVQQVYNDCKTYLIGENQLQHRTGVEISETMSELLEVAYRKLYRWVRGETKFLEIYNDPEVPALMVLAFEALQERPVLLSYCLTEIAQTRSKAVVDGFIEALTIGGPNGVPRPIDMHAHDPKRYVGDMAAFVHQALASELELLHGSLLRRVGKSVFMVIRSSQISELTQGPPTETMPSSVPVQDNPALHPGKLSPEDICFKEVMSKLLDIELTGMCRPFSSRVEQVFASNPNPPLLYHLANLFYYYSHILGHHLDANAAILRTFAECQESAYKSFFRALGARMTFLLQSRPPTPSVDLSPTHEFTEIVIILQDIMKILETSIIPAEDKEYEALPILDRIVDPLLESCIVGLQTNNSALKPGSRGMPIQGNISSADPTVFSVEQAVYLINCHTSICKVLEEYPFCLIKLAHLKNRIDAHVVRLVTEQASIALHQCGLSAKIAAIQQYEALKASSAADIPPRLAQVPEMEASAIKATCRNFEANILELGALSMAQIDKIEDDRVRSQARTSASDMMAEAYTTLFNAVSDADSGYDNPDAILRYKPGQVKMMVTT